VFLNQLVGLAEYREMCQRWILDAVQPISSRKSSCDGDQKYKGERKGFINFHQAFWMVFSLSKCRKVAQNKTEIIIGIYKSFAVDHLSFILKNIPQNT